MHPSHASADRARRGSSLPAILLLPAAVAVAAGLLALRLHFQPPTVPLYALGAPGAPGRHLEGTRDGGDEAVRVPWGGHFSIEVHPSAPVVGAVGARAFLVRGAEVRPWDPPFAVERDGSLRIEGPVDTLFAGVSDGSWEIALAVGRPETLPTAPRDILREEAGHGGGAAAWRLVRERIKIGNGI
jgi:hypothetical protein